MPKSNRPGSFGQRGGTITVIEQPVMRNYMRKAKIVFWIVWVAVGLLAATVLTSHLHPPVLALFAGAFVGLITRRDRRQPSSRRGRSSGSSGGGCLNCP